MKVKKFFEWLFWNDYIPYYRFLRHALGDMIVYNVFKHAKKYQCTMCGKEFYANKSYPVCMNLKCWMKYY